MDANFSLDWSAFSLSTLHRTPMSNLEVVFYIIEKSTVARSPVLVSVVRATAELSKDVLSTCLSLVHPTMRSVLNESFFAACVKQ